MTLPLLEVLDIDSYVVDASTTEADLSFAMEGFRKKLSAGKSVAFVVRRDALQYEKAVKYSNEYSMCREEVIRHIAAVSGEDPVVSTTGKASRELFELREASGLGHRYDFLTVGSMGHSSSIALGVALHKPEARIWCIDGDGAALMHMGAMAVIGSIQPGNLVHIVINNGAHETVGGMPTAAGAVSLTDVARATAMRCRQALTRNWIRLWKKPAPEAASASLRQNAGWALEAIWAGLPLPLSTTRMLLWNIFIHYKNRH